MNHRKFPSPVPASLIIAALITAVMPAVYSRSSQQKQEPPLKLKSELIQFDVLVTDKSDRPVTGLKKEDFVLLDSGKPQDIAFFSFVNAAGTESGQPVAEPGMTEPEPSPVAPAPGRTIFLIIDSFFTSKESYPLLKKSLVRLIDEDLSPDDQVAIISTNGALAGFQQATRNKKILLLAVQAFLGGGSADYASEAAVDAELASAQQNIGMPRSSASAQYVEQKRRDTLRTLLSVVKAASDVPGRKIAFLISEDLTMRLNGLGDPSENLYQELDEIISQSRNGGMTFYTIDPRGLVSPMPNPGESFGAAADRLLNAQSGLRELAAGTGGHAILNNNDLHAGLQKVMTENSSYYALSYYPADLPDKRQFRNVKIQVKGRPDLKVSSRTGYLWTGSPQSTQKPAEAPKQQRVSAALASVTPVRDLRVNIQQAEVARDEKSGERVARMTISIDPRLWPFKSEGADQLATFEVTGFAYDLHNKLVDGYSKDYTLRLNPANLAAVMKQGMNLHGEIKLKKPGLYSLRVVVIDKETNRLGSATEWVQAQ